MDLLNRNNFHDIDYEGVVLKIPLDMILTNPKLVNVLSQLSADLKSCDKSIFMPAHSRNLFELNNYNLKHEFAKLESQKRTDRINSDLERKRKRLDHIHLPIHLSKKAVQESDRLRLRINGVWFNEDDIMTKNFNMKIEFKQIFEQILNQWHSNNELDSFINFCVENGFYVAKELLTPRIKISDVKLYVSQQGTLCLKFPVEYVEFWEIGKKYKDKIYVNSVALHYDKELEKYYICRFKPKNFNIDCDILYNGQTRYYLDDYQLINNMFVKK